MNLERIVIAGVNPTKDFQQQRKIKDALKKIAELTKRIVGHDVEFDFAYDASQVSPTSCDLLIVVGKDDERTNRVIKTYRSFNRRGDARLVDLTSRYDVFEQLYVAYLAWRTKQESLRGYMVA